MERSQTHSAPNAGGPPQSSGAFSIEDEGYCIDFAPFSVQPPSVQPHMADEAMEDEDVEQIVSEVPASDSWTKVARCVSCKISMQETHEPHQLSCCLDSICSTCISDLPRSPPPNGSATTSTGADRKETNVVRCSSCREHIHPSAIRSHLALRLHLARNIVDRQSASQDTPSEIFGKCCCCEYTGKLSDACLSNKPDVPLSTPPCGGNLCSGCVEVHMKMRNFNSHQITKIVSAKGNPYLDIVKSDIMKCRAKYEEAGVSVICKEPVKVYCSSCRVSACSKCLVRSHLSKECDKKPFPDAAAIIVAQYGNLGAMMQEKLEQIRRRKEMVRNNMGLLYTKRDDCVSQVKTYKNRLLNTTIVKLVKELEPKFKDACRPKIEENRRIRKTLQEQSKPLERAIQFFQHVEELKKFDCPLGLMMKESLRETVQKILSKPLPALPQSGSLLPLHILQSAQDNGSVIKKVIAEAALQKMMRLSQDKATSTGPAPVSSPLPHDQRPVQNQQAPQLARVSNHGYRTISPNTPSPVSSPRLQPTQARSQPQMAQVLVPQDQQRNHQAMRSSVQSPASQNATPLPAGVNIANLASLGVQSGNRSQVHNHQNNIQMQQQYVSAQQRGYGQPQVDYNYNNPQRSGAPQQNVQARGSPASYAPNVVIGPNQAAPHYPHQQRIAPPPQLITPQSQHRSYNQAYTHVNPQQQMQQQINHAYPMQTQNGNASLQSFNNHQGNLAPQPSNHIAPQMRQLYLNPNVSVMSGAPNHQGPVTYAPPPGYQSIYAAPAQTMAPNNQNLQARTAPVSNNMATPVHPALQNQSQYNLGSVDRRRGSNEICGSSVANIEAMLKDNFTGLPQRSQSHEPTPPVIMSNQSRRSSEPVINQQLAAAQQPSTIVPTGKEIHNSQTTAAQFSSTANTSSFPPLQQLPQFRPSEDCPAPLLKPTSAGSSTDSSVIEGSRELSSSSLVPLSLRLLNTAPPSREMASSSPQSTEESLPHGTPEPRKVDNESVETQSPPQNNVCEIHEDEVHEDDDACAMCGIADDDNMWWCGNLDKCGRALHMQCCIPKLTSLPSTNLVLCLECVNVEEMTSFQKSPVEGMGDRDHLRCSRILTVIYLSAVSNNILKTLRPELDRIKRRLLGEFDQGYSCSDFIRGVLSFFQSHRLNEKIRAVIEKMEKQFEDNVKKHFKSQPEVLRLLARPKDSTSFSNDMQAKRLKC